MRSELHVKAAVVFIRYLPLYSADVSKLMLPFVNDGAEQVAAINIFTLMAIGTYSK